MARETPLVTKGSTSFEVRNAVISIFQKMPEGPERTAVEELFDRFNDYIEFNSGSMPSSEEGTPHENRIAKLKATIAFFEAMSHNLHSLGLISNWNETPKKWHKLCTNACAKIGQSIGAR